MKTYEEHLKARAASLEKSLEDDGLLPPKKKPVSPEDNEYTIDLLLSQKRIKVSFKFDPGYETGKTLTDFGFQWLIGHPIYEHDDTQETRKFLNEYLGADLELEQSVTLEIRDENAPQPIPDSSDFEEYVIKVKKLLTHYKIDQADLGVLAIDTLYKTTFPN